MLVTHPREPLGPTQFLLQSSGHVTEAVVFVHETEYSVAPWRLSIPRRVRLRRKVGDAAPITRFEERGLDRRALRAEQACSTPQSCRLGWQLRS